MLQRKSILTTCAIFYLQDSFAVYRSVSMETIKSRVTLGKRLAKETTLVFTKFSILEIIELRNDSRLNRGVDLFYVSK